MRKKQDKAPVYTDGLRKYTVMPWMVVDRQLWRVVFQAVGMWWSLMPKTAWHQTKDEALEELEKLRKDKGWR